MKLLAQFGVYAVAIFALVSTTIMVGVLLSKFGATEFQQGGGCMAAMIGLPYLMNWLSEKAGM